MPRTGKKDKATIGRVVGVEKLMAAAGMKRPCVERFDFGRDLRSAKS